MEKNQLFAPENSIYFPNSLFIQASSIILEIKEKQEISQRFHSLSYAISWLKAAISLKDHIITGKAIESALKNKYSSISSIADELNSLKESIEKLENIHLELLKSGLSLDVKALMEQEFTQKRKKLEELHSKQKGILLNLSYIFTSLAKDSVKKKSR